MRDGTTELARSLPRPRTPIEFLHDLTFEKMEVNRSGSSDASETDGVQIVKFNFYLV
jgi:hypothetical protein